MSTWVVIILVKRDLPEFIWDSYTYIQRNCTRQEAEKAARAHFTPDCRIELNTHEMWAEAKCALLEGPTIYED
jgi:hypothetical protein